MTEFAILGCALSNTSDDAYPFAVVFKLTVGDEAKLESYVLHSWQNYEDFFPDNARETLLDLLDDLREYPSGEQSHRFFKHLKTLNFGYVRFLAEGRTQTVPLMSGEASAYFDGQSHPVTWPESFKKL